MHQFHALITIILMENYAKDVVNNLKGVLQHKDLDPLFISIIELTRGVFDCLNEPDKYENIY